MGGWRGAVVEIDELRRIRRNLDRFLRRFKDCIKTRPSRKHLRTYVRGQVSDLERKSVEPIALAQGVAPRSLQEFLGLHRWDQEKVRTRVQEMVMREHADENAIGVIDETGFPKKGEKTAGVQRQYCGASGKIDNCVVTVNLGYVAEDFHTMIDADLYLPEDSWHRDRVRCRAAGVPEEVVYRPKWRIALELLDRSMGNGVRLRYLAADEEYGKCGAFRRGVAARGLVYVVEAPCSTAGWTKRPPVLEPEAGSGAGRPRTRARLAPEAPRARRADRLWKHGGPSWERFHVKDTEKGPVVWEVRAIRFFPWDQDLPGEECWLLVARNVLDGEVKYFLSNAPKDTPIEVLLHVAFSRWRIERIFQDAKGQVGLDHFEVRNYLSLTRHLVLSMVSLLFLMEENERLRGKKPVVERPSGAHGSRGAA